MKLNLPNQLTILRVLLIPVFIMLLLGSFFEDLQTARYVATGIFVFASLTDMFDGYIARKYNLITNFGKFADPLADKMLVSAAMISMVQLGDLSAWVVILIISREFIVTGFRLVAASRNTVIAAGFWGKIKTVSQMLMIIIVLLNIDNTVFRAVGSGLIVISAVLTIVSMVDYIYKNIDVLKD